MFMGKKVKQSESSSENKKKKRMPDTIQKGKEKDFEKSKLRNKGKASNENLGGSLKDQGKKTKLL